MISALVTVAAGFFLGMLFTNVGSLWAVISITVAALITWRCGRTHNAGSHDDHVQEYDF